MKKVRLIFALSVIAFIGIVAVIFACGNVKTVKIHIGEDCVSVQGKGEETVEYYSALAKAIGKICGD